MFNQQILFKIIRYILLTAIIYLILRYTPYVKLESTKAFAVAIILLIISVILDILYNNFFIETNKISTENFSSNNCNSCDSGNSNNKTEPFEQSGNNNTKTCRIVCESNNKTEHFTAEEPQTTPIIPKKTPEAIPEIVETTKIVKKKPTNTSVQETPTADEYYLQARYPNAGYDTSYDNGFDGMFSDVGNKMNNSMNVGTYYGELTDKDRDVLADELGEDIKMQHEIDKRAHNINGYHTPYQQVGRLSEKHRVSSMSRAIDGELDDELPYTDYNHLPVASGYKSHAYEYGYSFLPPEKWYPLPVRPPICITEHRSPTFPVPADGMPTDVKEFHASRRITGPDQLNVKYVNDKMNAGR
jgi:hypothetical protein